MSAELKQKLEAITYPGRQETLGQLCAGAALTVVNDKELFHICNQYPG